MNRTIEANVFPEVVEPPKEKPCILIIDNNRDFTHSAKLALERTGRYFVCEENDASKAHQTAQGLKPDLILLDIAMPEADVARSPLGFNPIPRCTEYRLSF
jgi:CheY-like chemotaxis protein